MDEHQTQVAFFKWLRLKMPDVYEVAYAIPNGGQRHIRVATKLKAEGVKAGIPDICIPIGRHGFHALYIEMKSLTGAPTKKQLEKMNALSRWKNMCALCKGLDAAIDTVTAYMDERERIIY